MAECSASFGMEADEMCSFWVSKIKTARKSHKCEECRQEIKIGDKYESLAYYFDGFHHEKRCAVCCEVRNAFLEDGSCYCPGDMWTEIADYVFPWRMTLSASVLTNYRRLKGKPNFAAAGWGMEGIRGVC